MRQGDAGDNMHVVLEGRMSVWKEPPVPPKQSVYDVYLAVKGRRGSDLV